MLKKHQDIFIINFGKNLKRVRKELGFSQESLAYESGIELRQIGRIERGEINTGIYTLKIIAEVLKIEPYELMKFKY